MQAVTAIGAILAAWALVGGACLGWGAVGWKILSPRTDEQPGVAALFWLGLSLLLALLQLWHLVLPVDWLASAVLLGAGWLAFFPGGAGKSVAAARPTRGHAAVLGLLALWLAYRGLDYPRNYDSGLYHFSTIRWINEYPAVPGLANLHERLGFNQSYFLFVALLNAHPFTNEGYHAANSLLWFVLSAQLLGLSWPLLRNPAGASLTALAAGVLLPVILAQALGGDISSPTPDLAVFAFGVTVFIFLTQAAESAAPGAGTILPVLIMAGCTIKLSFVAYGAAVAGGLYFILRLHQAARGARQLTVRLILAGLFWGVPYAIHGIILSGYPAFPATFPSWSADWRLPAADANDTASWILSWGRAPGKPAQEVLGSWSWFQPWLERMLKHSDVTWPLVGAAIAIGFIAVAAGRNGGWVAKRRVVLLQLAPVIAGLVFWFFTAPDPRFANWLFWLLAASLLAGAVWVIQPLVAWPLPARLALASLGAGLVVLAHSPDLPPRARAYGLHSFHRVQTRDFFTATGLRVIVPAEGADPRLWDAPLPAAPIGKAGLMMRGTSLRDGFRTTTAPAK